MYPLLMDVYYPIVEQGGYGNVKKQWVLDKSVACAFVAGGVKAKKDVQPDAKIDIDNSIVGRIRGDITTSSRGTLNSLTNIIVTNIRDANGNVVYNEPSGPRAGMATIFEVATFNPVVGPFGTTEYFKLVLRRSENQAADL
jgi:hypothetical protein